MMAMENPHITADVIEAIEFPYLGQKYQVMAVPKTVINETVQFEGAVPEPQFLTQVQRAAG